MQRGRCDCNACLKAQLTLGTMPSYTPDGTIISRGCCHSSVNASILKGVPKFDTLYGEFLVCRGAKFKLVKTMFNAGSFILSISGDFGAVHS